MTRPETTVEPAGGGRPARFAWSLFALLLVLVALTWRDALGAWFAADDFHWLEVGRLDDVLGSFVGPWGHGPAYRPLARVSFYLDYLAFGLDARPWHAESLVLHALCATLLGILLDRLSGERAFAVAAAAIFALLPTGYENTIWLSGRIHLLGMGFSLAALIALDHLLLRPSRRAALACLAAYSLALLSYEASVYVAPLALLVAFVRRRQVPSRRALVRAIVAIWALTAVYLVLRRLAIGSETLYPLRSFESIVGLGFVAHLSKATRMLVSPIRAWLWPLLGCAVVSAFVAPRFLAIALLGVGVAVVGFAPYALLQGLAARFLFASGVGVAIAVAALLAGLARLPWLGKAAALALLLLVLDGERRTSEAIASEWRLAGQVGRQVLENLVAASPQPARDGAVVVFGAPRAFKRSMIFFTYFEAALRVFRPDYPRFGILAEHILEPDPTVAVGRISTIWEMDAARRRELGRPPLPCPAAAPPLREGVEGFVRALADCESVFLKVDPRTNDVTRLEPAWAADWLLRARREGPAALWAPPVDHRRRTAGWRRLPGAG